MKSYNAQLGLPLFMHVPIHSRIFLILSGVLVLFTQFVLDVFICVWPVGEKEKKRIKVNEKSET